MRILIAVAEELFSFAVEQVATVGGRSRGGEQRAVALPADRAVLRSVRSAETPTKEKGTVIPLPPHAAFNETEGAAGIKYYQGVTPQKNSVMYVASTHTPLRSEPTILRDTIIGIITYGSMVMVLEVKNGWSRVLNGKREGWVEVRDLAQKAVNVLPQFIIGEKNEADDPNTIRLRAIINDEFSGGSAGLPLQSHEYVLYKLLRRDRVVAWPLVRPRKPGSWGDILQNIEGITIPSFPSAGSIIEFLTEENIGHLAYVEAVFPDESIQISEANWPESGIYNERVLVKDEWQNLLPRFIKVA